MKLLFLSLFLFVSMGTSSLTHASTCLTNGSSVDARNGFCVTFNLNSDGSNRIRLENSQYFPMWTDDDDFDGYYQQIFDEDYIDDGTARQFQIKFERTSNFNARWISGKITYSVNGIQKQVINNFDLSYATGADKFNPFVKDKALAIAMEVLIPENFPGPWLTKTLFSSAISILFSLINLNNNNENFSLLFLLASKDL